jgi:hypothetical protein
MPGGIMQLVSTGGLDQYIIGSPEISYFKAVYKRHTNFAMESVRQTFLTAPVLTTGVTTVTCRIGRIGDLLSDVFFNFRLPAIYSRNVAVGNETKNYKFRWIKNIGEYVIRKYSLRMDTQLIDEGYGEWIEIWNELSLPAGKRAAYNEMIGNVSEVFNPVANNAYAVIRNNNLTFESYNVSDGTTPSIEERRVIVPIPFWFSKNPALALPLVALQYQTVDVILELRSVEDLYQVFDENADVYVSPVEYSRRYPAEAANVSIQNFVKQSVSVLPNTLDLNAHLECNYVFLDDAERRLIATSTLDYLVERIYRSEQGGITSQGTMNLVISNPVKEMIWFARRNDVSSYNDWTNFTRTYPEDKRYPIMATAKFMWNGMERMEEKSGDYFNKIQPFQHHSNGPRQGLYSYSFALHPEKWQPSGSFNASMISRIQMYVTTNVPPSSTEEYAFTVYSMYYNVFHVVAGTAGMVNAN